MTFAEFSEMDTTEEASARIARAALADVTPLPGTLNKENGSARFRGEHGEYFTVLDSCDCRDFERRKRPCKHMYRLAHELGEFEIDNVQANYRMIPEITAADKQRIFSQYAALLDSCPESDLQILYSILNAYNYHIDRYPIVLNRGEAVFLLNSNFVTLETNPEIILKTLGKKRVSESLDKIKYPFPKQIKTQSGKFDYILNSCKEDALLIEDYYVIKLTQNAAVVSHKLYKEVKDILDSDILPIPVAIPVSAKTRKIVVDDLEEYVLQYINNYIEECLSSDNLQVDKPPKKESFDFASVDDLIEHLKQFGIKFIDKRSKGGCLWIIGGTEYDETLKEVTVNKIHLKKATSKFFHGNPGWYIK